MTTSKKRLRAEGLKKTCSIIERIAAQFAPDSVEHQALMDAAYALIFVTSHEMLRSSYEKFRKNCDQPLTRSQKAVLKGYGIEL